MVGFVEVALEEVLGNFGYGALRIDSSPGFGNCHLADIGTEHLNGGIECALGQKIRENHDDRICFLTRRAARCPNPDRIVSGAILYQPWKYLRLQDLQRLRVGKEQRYINN